MRLWHPSGSFLYVGLAALAVAILTGCSPARPGEQPAPSSLVERGGQLYDANCRSCHGGATGGRIMDIPPVHNANGHTWHHPDCLLREIVLNGSGQMGNMMRQMMPAPEDTPRMPAFKGTLTEEDIGVILASIKTWWTEEQREFQVTVTRQAC